MAIKNKRPPRKESVGAQYVCFSTPGEDDEWSGQYEEDVERTAVVKSVSVTDNSESQDVYSYSFFSLLLQPTGRPGGNPRSKYADLQSTDGLFETLYINKPSADENRLLKVYLPP